MSPPTIQTPASAALCTVGQRLGLIEVHQQWRVFECIQPNVDERLLKWKRRHVRTPAFAPVTDRRNIDAFQKWIAVIAPARFGDQLAPIFQVQRIGKVWLPDFAVFVGVFVRAPCSGFSNPFRQCVFIRIGHQTDGKRLSVCACLRYREIDDCPIEFPRLWLEHIPIPTAI